MRKFKLFGVKIDTMKFDDAVEKVLQLAVRRDVPFAAPRHIAFVNADCMNSAYTDWDYKLVLDRADHVFADGQGVGIASRCLGPGRLENVNGTDMFPRLCEASAAEDGPSLYFLGGKPGIATTCADEMTKRYPGLRVVGARDGYFDAEDEGDIVAEINRVRPDILLVGMGAPRQEKWIARHRERLDVGVAIGVGGLFDFYSGRIPRAPLFLRKAGFEWVWRLAMEPRRMFRRYILGNPLFLLRLLREHHALTSRADAAELRQRFRKSERGRRQQDILVAAIGLVLIAPVVTLAALAIRLESPGPIFFVQERVGRRGEPFRLWKLRTMYTDAEERKAALLAENEMEGGVLFKMKADPRVTRIGKVLRKYSIDELPQLWNVLRGEMAIAGPRPALPEEVAQYGAKACERLRVRPGLTGLWQISGRSSLPFDEQIKLDIENAARRSQRYDAKLILRTAPAVIRGSGAW